MIKDKSIFIKNIYYMLSYAFTTLNQGGYEDVAAEEFENVHNLFAAILAKGIGRQLKQGLYREYLNRKEDVAVVRGKIDMPGTIQNRLSRKRVLTCEYDELSENNLLNRILKTTVMLLLRYADVDREYKSDLKKEMLFFSNVDTIDPGTIRWSALRFQRNNNTYRMLISLCQLILEGMLLTADSGEYRLASFIDEQRMNRLYEKFILEYYIKECPQVTATSSQIPWALDDGIGTLLPVMQSDIMLTRGNEVLIIDAKYYTHTTQVRYDVHTLHSGNLYQVFTYVKNKEAEFGNKPHRVSGMLLYAATDEAIQPDNSYQMSGNQISVRTLDLNRNFPEIAAQLNGIVNEHFADDLFNSKVCTKMVDVKRVHDFAVKWRDKFKDRKVNYIEWADHYMADECASIGFEMDCGHAFFEKYGSAAGDGEALNNIINDVDDITLLGSAIYSRWRYFNHWAYTGEEILEPGNRAWFILALSRLAALTGNEHHSGR